jgi:hypothetical protein
VTIPDALKVLRDYSRYPDYYPPSVVHAEAGPLGDSDDQLSMVLLKQLEFRKLALDADYSIHRVRVDERRLYSITRTTLEWPKYSNTLRIRNLR